MGRGIARVCLAAGYSVYLQDVDSIALQNAAAALADVQVQLHLGTSPAGFAGTDLIIECIPESLPHKHRWLTAVEPVVAPETVLATNTSSIPVARLSEALRRPERLCGLHFCHPVEERRLVELICGPTTCETTRQRAVDLVRRLNKVPVEVADGPGFVLNRLLSLYLGEALDLLQSGVEPHQLTAAALRLGMPCGPLQQLDEFGLETSLAVGRTLWEAFPDRWAPSELLIAVCKLRRRQPQSRRGFCRTAHGAGRHIPGSELDPEVQQIVRQRQRSSFVPAANQIDRRLWLPLLLEALRIVDEGLVGARRDVDAILELGLGMRPGGLRLWERAEHAGVHQLLAWLRPLQPLGGRFVPDRLLAERLSDFGVSSGGIRTDSRAA